MAVDEDREQLLWYRGLLGDCSCWLVADDHRANYESDDGEE